MYKVLPREKEKRTRALSFSNHRTTLFVERALCVFRERRRILSRGKFVWMILPERRRERERVFPTTGERKEGVGCRSTFRPLDNKSGRKQEPKRRTLRQKILEKKSTFFPRVSEPKRESEKKSKDVFFWSDDESAEKTDREERFFVGFDREERRYLFHTHSSEIEFE